MTKLVVVESPTKAKTIKDFLPDGYVVMASMGHIRDLPSTASEIPKSLRDQAWSRIGVNVGEGFDPLYVISSRRKDTIKTLRQALADADELIIATDEDREGESIGWHLVEVLKPNVPVRRMVFHEITREAIQEALASPRDIDDHLVRAQETRRILDRLVGYTLSPLLWRKIAPRLSAGRVQSVAVRLLVERERERHAFRSGSYWDIKAHLSKRPDREDHRFEATLRTLGGKRLATGRDFDDSTGRLKDDVDVLLLGQEEVEELRGALEETTFSVDSVSTRDAKRRPYAPFTTSTLQQEAGRKLRLSARQTMRVAQALYENGYITYHRTDSVNLSGEAVGAARRRVKELYGEDYLSPKPRTYKTKAKSAQEAHEAIRPSGSGMTPVAELPIRGTEAQLYDLIWKRTMATQMADARLQFVTVDVATEARDAVFRATGRRVVFPGFFRAYVEGSDDPDAAIEDRDAPLPEMDEGEAVDARELEPVGHETKPPARFTEASLVKELEAAGVGRPSTYATILGTVQDRGYADKNGSALVPTFTAFAVTGLLESDFEQLVDLGFTSEMEEDLDRIAAGTVDWQDYLARFWSGDEGLEAQVEDAAERIDPRVASTVDLGDVAVRIGRYGPFIEVEENGDRHTVGVPEDLAPGDLTPEIVQDLRRKATEGPATLGKDPDTGKEVMLKDGPYGPYLQLGDVEEGSKEKPKRVSVPKAMEPSDIDLDIGLQLLALPRELGRHPETDKPVKAGIGRYGPYVVHDGTFASLKKEDDVLSVGLERSLELIKEKKARRSKRANVLRELGEHPETGKAVELLDGRYGPYVRHARTNASLPKDMDPDDVDLDKAVELIAAKKAKGGKKRKRR